MADPGKNERDAHNGAGSDRSHAQNGRNGHGQGRQQQLSQQSQDLPTSQATFDARSLWPSIQSWLGSGVRRMRSQVLRRTATTGPEVTPSGGDGAPPSGSRPENIDPAAPSRSGAGFTETDGGNPHRRLNAPSTGGSKQSLKNFLKKTGLGRKKRKGAYIFYTTIILYI